jgi:hypothetical protein
VKGLASPLEFAWPGGAGFDGLAEGELLELGDATVVVDAGGPLLAAAEDMLLVTEAVPGGKAEAAVAAGGAGAAIDEAEVRLLVTVVVAGVVTEAAVEAGAVGLPVSSAIVREPDLRRKS